MSRLLPFIALSALGLAPSFVGASDSEPAQPWQWMAGVHTNYQYTLRNPEAAATPLLYRIQLIDQSEAEGIILHSEQAYLFAPDSPLRQRVYQFIERSDGWLQHIYELELSADGHSLAEPESWQPLHGCSIYWTQQGDHFSAANNPRHCYFLLEDDGERVEVSSEITLYPNYFLLNDNFVVSDEVGQTLTQKQVQTEYQRTTFYDVEVSYSALNDEQWESAETVMQIHDQGVRSGFILSGSGLELRYQVELRRELDTLTFTLHDISRDSVVHEQVYAHDVEVIEYSSAQLYIKMKPRP